MSTDAPIWKNFTHDREFPVSTVASITIHLLVGGLLIAAYFSDRNKTDTIEWESIVIAEPPGAGNGGTEPVLKHGNPLGADVAEAIEKRPARPPEEVDIIKPTVPPAEPLVLPDNAGGPLTPSAKPRIALPKLASLLKGVETGNASRGTGGPGPATGGIGKGTSGSGTGPDGGGRISQKTKRQLRWTLLFSTTGPADYLGQMTTLKAELGVQARDSTIRMIRDLARRPARLESSRPPAERIFWMDDNPESVQALAAELQIGAAPWRVIAFFPESLEKLLLDKELLYGKAFNRNSEDDIQETKFRVEFRYGQPRISVVEQH
ncbi:MAG: hypothetical protein ACJ8F7_11855 [Gemmataceae bacterium]